MFKRPNMATWHGRTDSNETSPAWRWHQKVAAWDGVSALNGAIALLGFACDEGVKRNQGRSGAAGGPTSLRRSLANIACHHRNSAFDAGDIECEDADLEKSQTQLADHLVNILRHGGRPIVVGGGHEIAWGSFQGITAFLAESAPDARLGILNFDAHFDLRNPAPQPNSGTAFRQMANWCIANKKEFIYRVLGLNASANTGALFEFAKGNRVHYLEDVECTADQLPKVEAFLARLVDSVDVLYVSICMDVFPAATAPGVSAPAAIGVDPALVVRLIRKLGALCRDKNVKVLLTDFAELNPRFDHEDQRTAKLAARLVSEVTNNFY